MRILPLCTAVVAVAATGACYHTPIATGAAPSSAKTPADANAPGYVVFDVLVEPAVSAAVNADAPGYYIDDIRVDAPR